MLPIEWNENDDPTGWWMSEKLDGVRAIWDGERLLTRYGIELLAPGYFINGLPKDMKLDGELWLGRGTFDTLVQSIFSPENEIWKKIRYMLFDLPSFDDIYENRMTRLRELSLPSHVQVMETFKCQGSNLKEFLRSTVEGGGEGIILNKSKSYYNVGRSDAVRKFKVNYPIQILNA
jgi:DNA ligase-1